MKNRILFIAAFVIASTTSVLGQAGFEQYYYWGGKETPVLVPLLHIQTPKNWYGEVRYNYEERGTFSVYAGRTFSKEHKRFSYALTPVAGGVFGNWQGGSVGLNTTLEFSNIFLSSQSQFSFSSRTDDQDFLFTWTEVGYEPVKWFYFGLSFQHTHEVHQRYSRLERGAMIGFTAGKWSFPLYGFNLMGPARYFILGINLGIGLKKIDY